MDKTLKRKTTLGLVFWVFIIMGSVVAQLSELAGNFLIIIAFALGIVWLFRKFKK